MSSNHINMQRQNVAAFTKSWGLQVCHTLLHEGCTGNVIQVCSLQGQRLWDAEG